MAYAMNYEVYKSMDALELAVQLEPDHFFAQFKYAELQYRLRALIKAEKETLKALDLASHAFGIVAGAQATAGDPAVATGRNTEARMDQASRHAGTDAGCDGDCSVADGDLPMNRKWSFFVGAVLLASYLLISRGAPPAAVVAGIVMAGFWTRRASRSA